MFYILYFLPLIDKILMVNYEKLIERLDSITISKFYGVLEYKKNEEYSNFFRSGKTSRIKSG